MILIFICFFLSGFGGLVYESLWTRHLTHVIGGSPYAISIILSVFMGGLGLGGALGGRLADRIARPAGLLRTYGILELIIGAYAIALPSIMSAFQPVFAAVYGKCYGQPFLYKAIVSLLCALLLIVPVLCMGATLPVLGKYCVRRPDRVGGPLSFLYAINTIGAAVGVLAAGFWLFPTLGLKATALCAAAVNAAVGGLCLFLARREASSSPTGSALTTASETVVQAKPSATKEPTVTAKSLDKPPAAKSPRAIPDALPDSHSAFLANSLSSPLPAGFRAAVIIFALSGFCAMAYEVVWTKVLTLIMGPTTYSFTLVLAVFITGLALGGWAFGRIADRIANPGWLLAVTQGAAALLALAAGHRMGNSLFLFQKIDFLFNDRFGGSLFLKSLFLFVFMLAPAVCLGAAFPLTMRMAARTGDHLGRSIGFAYAANTFGGVLGAWSAGFLLIPHLGSETSLGLLAALQAIGAGALAFRSLRGRKEAASRWILACAPALLALLSCFAYPNWDRTALGKAANRNLGEELGETSWMDAMLNHHPATPALMPESQVFYGDGIGGFTSVWRSANLLGGEEYSLFVSGKADASSQADMFTQVLLSQFPMLMHPHPKRVMVLGLASGVTAGEVLNYDVDRLDVLEINPQVAQASDFFKPWNNNVLADPRTRLILQDAKAHLLLSREKYDVIISEPSNPWMAGLAELFTREFFQRAKASLNDGGVMVEFLHSYQMDWNIFSMVGRTFAEVFPDGMLVRTMPDDRRLPGSASDYLLVGFKGGKELPDAMRPALRDNPEKRAALAKSRNLKLSDPRLFSRLVEGENLKDLFGPGPIHTDDKPLLEFAAPKLRFTYDSRAIEAAIAAGAVLSDSLRRLRDSLRTDPEARLGFAEYALSVFKPFPGMLPWAETDSLQRRRFKPELEGYCTAIHVTDWDFLDDGEMRTACSVMQMGALNRTLKTGGSATVYLAMGEVCMVNGVAGNAYKFYGKALEIAGEGSYVGREARSRMEQILAAVRDAHPGAENPVP